MFDTILSKLVGRAADSTASRTELKSWNKFEYSLLVTFSDQRSIDCVVQDIITMRPERGESPQNFGLRLQEARSILFSKINMSDDENEVNILKNPQYHYHMQLVRLKNAAFLEEAMAFAREVENFLSYKNRSNNI